MIRVDYSLVYSEDYQVLISKNPELKQEINKRIKWFKNKPADTRLDNHILTGKLANKWAFSITDDVRVLYKWIGKNKVIFLAIGGHNKVYNKQRIN